MVSVYNIGMTCSFPRYKKKQRKNNLLQFLVSSSNCFFFMGNKTSDKLMDFDIALILIVALWIYENILTMIGT